MNKRTGKAIVVEQLHKPLREWRAVVADAAGQYVEKHPGEFPVVGQPVQLALHFRLQRPKAHYSAKGGVKDSFLRVPHLVAPDFDKLARAVADACTGILWRDDSLIVRCEIWKGYADPAPIGVEIEMMVVR